MDCLVVILNGGQGTRAGLDKTRIPIRGHFPVYHVIKEVRKVLPRAQIEVVGGPFTTRHARTNRVLSLWDVLATHPDFDKILILDSARWLVTAADISRLLRVSTDIGAFYQPAYNTIIDASSSKLWDRYGYETHTPHIFTPDKLRKCLKLAIGAKSNELTAAIRYYREDVTLIRGNPRTAYKHTYPMDLPVMLSIFDVRDKL